MRVLNNSELMEINGGGSIITAAFLNAAARAIDTVLNLGRSLGTSIRRVISGSYCSL